MKEGLRERTGERKGEGEGEEEEERKGEGEGEGEREGEGEGEVCKQRHSSRHSALTNSTLTKLLCSFMYTDCAIRDTLQDTPHV